MYSPKVSFILPVYNVEKYLEQCINSLLFQTYTLFEIILVDDGSTDDSSNICEEFCRKDNRIKAYHKQNGGLSDARNYGLKKATGDFVIFVDSDDYWTDGCSLDILVSKSNESDLVYYGYKRKFGDKEILQNNINLLYDHYDNGYDFLFDILKKFPNYEWYSWQYMIKKDLLISNHIEFPFGLTYEDMMTSYKFILLSKNVTVCKKHIYCYRTREDSITSTVSINNHKNHIESMELSIIDVLNRNDIAPFLKELLLNNMSLSFYGILINASTLSKNEANELINILDRKKYIINYTKYGKQRFARTMINVLGIRFTAFVLSLRRKLKYGK